MLLSTSFGQCLIFHVAAAAIVADAAREYLAWKIKPDSIWVKLIPIPSMVGIPAFIGGYFCVDMTIGAIILGIWQYFAPADALISAPLVASALIAGDGVWSVPSAILALAKVSPPMCAQVCLGPYASYARCLPCSLLGQTASVHSWLCKPQHQALRCPKDWKSPDKPKQPLAFHVNRTSAHHPGHFLLVYAKLLGVQRM